jgi:methylmalonyl-CoA epimerase
MNNIVKMNHIGIAVKDAEQAKAVYEAIGLSVDHVEEVAEQKTRTHFIPVGDTAIELLESMNPESAIGKFIEARGEGIHHIAIEVADVAAAIKQCQDAGLRMIDGTPRSGAHGTKVAFIHPKATLGTMIELVQK